MKIIDKIWFTEMGSTEPIGIVIIETEVGERKAYVGKGLGINEEEDAKFIAKRGAKFGECALSQIRRGKSVV